MMTASQMENNRLNTQKYTRTRSDAGQTSSRLNAFKHDAYASARTITGETQAERLAQPAIPAEPAPEPKPAPPVQSIQRNEPNLAHTSPHPEPQPPTPGPQPPIPESEAPASTPRGFNPKNPNHPPIELCPSC